jgi:hypothetical protein
MLGPNVMVYREKHTNQQPCGQGVAVIYTLASCRAQAYSKLSSDD